MNLSSTKRSTSLPPNNLTYNNNTNEETHNNNQNSVILKTTMNTFDNLRVVIRLRPPLQREMEQDLPFRSIGLVSNDGKSVSLVEYLGAELNEAERQREWVENPSLFQLHHFTFDYVFDMDASQSLVYEHTAKPAVISVLEGYNSTIFAYGQTGTGKTYTMEGFTYNNSDVKRGIIPRSIEEIFNYIESFSSANTKFMVRASYLQIYNESISDLLKNDRIGLQIREDKKKGVFVDGLSEWAVRTPQDIYSLLQKGALSRATAATKMNDVSSRSHAVFVITLEQMTIEEVDGKTKETRTQIKVGKLNLVDLAGSERIRVTGATGKQLEESKKINRSLSALGNVIYALTDTKNRTHIPYRDSKLTRLLEDSLGGNCKTTMMAMVSPAHESFNESLSTLHFARRAKNIKNRPRINEDVDHKALIRQYEVELKKLRSELEEKNRLIHSNELVIQLEEQRKRAEEDKQAAIYALEQASRQYLQEREEKKKLEQKITMMNSQMITGGHKIEEHPQFRHLLEKEQSKLMNDFNMRLQEIEKERNQIEEEKAQVEKYKSLLLKQRDIMIALTTKLNERDEAIVQLQEEIDAYDKINKEQEENIERRNSKITMLETIMKRNNIKVPDDVNELSPRDKYHKRIGEKVYIPYHLERNEKEFENSPAILLSAEEKVNELNNIVREQEKEIDIMKMISNKIMNVGNNKDFLKSENFLNFKEMNYQIKTLESEKEKIMRDLYENDKKLQITMHQNKENLEQMNLFSQKIDEMNEERQQFSNILRTDMKRLVDVIAQHLNMDNNNSSRQKAHELVSFYKNLLNIIDEKSVEIARDISTDNINKSSDNLKLSNYNNYNNTNYSDLQRYTGQNNYNRPSIKDTDTSQNQNFKGYPNFPQNSNLSNLGDIKLSSSVKFLENTTGSKTSQSKEVLNSNSKNIGNNNTKSNNNLMNNFMLKSKEQERNFAGNPLNSSNNYKANLNAGGINFNNNINYLNLVSNLGNSIEKPQKNLNKK